ncbi:unnamed protein product [Rhizophagus irregularis]|nr:unnamed protein product [Rhizophagus irregularis]
MEQCWDADPSKRPDVHTLWTFHSNKSYDFNIPNNIDDFNKSSNQNSSKASKISSIFKANKTTQQTKGATNIVNFNDEDEAYNNPNLHSEEQNELEILMMFKIK